MKKYPYIVYINPRVRPRDSIDLWAPTLAHWDNTVLLGTIWFNAWAVAMDEFTRAVFDDQKRRTT